MPRVTRLMRFCYGHRLIGYKGKCRHPHGHNGTVEISVRRPRLDALGMVMDFSEIKARLGRWIDEELDHKMLLNKKDPLLKILRNMGEPVVAFKGNPTAENIARIIYERARKEKLPIVSVRLWETDDSFAEHGGD